MIDELVNSFCGIPKECKKIMDKVVSIDKDALLVKNEMEKLTSSFTAKLKEKEQKSKKRKRAIRDKGPRKKKKHEPTAQAELQALGNQLHKKHEQIMGYSEEKMKHAADVSKLVQDSIDRLDKKLFDVTREIRRSVNNGDPRLRKPITYQVLESVLQSELHIARMKKRYDEYNLLEKQDVIIHLRSLGRGEKHEIEMWERKVKRDLTLDLPEDTWALKNVEEERKPLRKNNHDRKTWCFCNQKASGQMIACDQDDCEIEWFHFVCVGLKVKPAGAWTCARCKSRIRTLPPTPTKPSQTAVT